MIALNLLAGLILSVNGVIHDCNNEVVNYINVTGSDITVQNCRVSDSGVGTNTVSVWGNRNTLRHLTVERFGGSGVYFFEGDGHVLEDSIIRDPIRRKGRDSWSVAVNQTTNLTVQRVTAYGSGLTQWGGDSRGTRILNNTFIVPDDYRTNCKGVIQRDGPCQCAEFGVALKRSTDTLIEGNTLSGYLKADPECGGTGTPGAGIATSADAEATGVFTHTLTIRNNVIRDSHNGLYTGPKTVDSVVEGNLFCDNDYGISDGYSVNARYTDNDFYNSPVNFYNNRPESETGSRKVRGCD